jgi:hypothetical protein
VSVRFDLLLFDERVRENLVVAHDRERYSGLRVVSPRFRGFGTETSRLLKHLLKFFEFERDFELAHFLPPLEDPDQNGENDNPCDKRSTSPRGNVPLHRIPDPQKEPHFERSRPSTS